jgi:hypothetical protein
MDQPNFQKFQTTTPAANALMDQVMAYFVWMERNMV